MWGRESVLRLTKCYLCTENLAPSPLFNFQTFKKSSHLAYRQVDDKPKPNPPDVVVLTQHVRCTRTQSFTCGAVRTLGGRSMTAAAVIEFTGLPASRPIRRWARHKQGVQAAGGYS